jgi:hypothetical protein
MRNENTKIQFTKIKMGIAKFTRQWHGDNRGTVSDPVYRAHPGGGLDWLTGKHGTTSDNLKLSLIYDIGLAYTV